MKRLRFPDGTPLNQQQVNEFIQLNPEYQGKINKYGYEEAGALSNLGKGALRSVQDIGDTAEYWLARGKDWINEGKKGYKPVAKEVSDRNIKSEQDYQEMTDGSIAAGLGRIGGTVGTAFIPGGIPAKLAQGASKVASFARMPKIASAASKVATGLTNNQKAKQELLKIVQEESKYGGLAKLPEFILNNSKIAVRGAGRGTLGYGLTSAKDENSGSLENILTYGAGGGALIGGIGAKLASRANKPLSETEKEILSLMDAGYTLKPSNVPNPGFIAPKIELLANLGGKDKLNNVVTRKNMENTNRIARREIGLDPSGASIAEADIAFSKTPSSNIYDLVRNSSVKSGIDNSRRLNDIKKYANDIASTGIRDPEIETMLMKSYPNGLEIPAEQTVRNIRKYGDMAKERVKKGDYYGSEFISNQKKNVEDSLQSALEKYDKSLFNKYKKARSDFAKIYKVENAINAGFVDPRKLNRLSKNSKFDDGLSKIAKFGEMYPNISYRQDIPIEQTIGLLPSVLSGIGASYNPYLAGAAFLPSIARKAITSPIGQKMIKPSKPKKSLGKVGEFLNDGTYLGFIQRQANPSETDYIEEY